MQHYSDRLFTTCVFYSGQLYRTNDFGHEQIVFRYGRRCHIGKPDDASSIQEKMALAMAYAHYCCSCSCCFCNIDYCCYILICTMVILKVID